MNIIKTFTMSSEEKQAEKTNELTKRAQTRAFEIYNIARIEGVDYVTLHGIPVSLADDAKSGSLCDRLDTYRKSFVDACFAANRVIGDASYS